MIDFSKRNKSNTFGQAMCDFTESLNNQRDSLRNMKLESYVSENTGLTSNYGDVLAAIKDTMKRGGPLAGFAGGGLSAKLYSESTRGAIKASRLAQRLKRENADDQMAEDEDLTEDTQNEEILLTKAQEEAGIAAAAIAGSPAETAEKINQAIQSANTSNNQAPIIATNGRYNTEAFSDENFRTAIGYTVIWNVVAARQSDAIENIWNTIVLDVDQFHVEAMVQYQVFHPEVRHKSTGEATDFGRIRLLEAIVNGEFLDQNIIKCYPVFEAGVNDDHFAPDNEIAHRVETVDGVTFVTAPLTVGMEHGMLGLSQAAIANLENELNSAAELAIMPRVETLYLRVENKDGDVSFMRIPALNMPRNAFLAAQEGNIKDVQLNMLINQLGFDAKSEDVTGAPAEAFKLLRDPRYVNHRIEFKGAVYGQGNLERGFLSSTDGGFSVAGIKRKTGNGVLNTYTVEKDNDILKELKDSIKSIKLAYIDFDARRTNRDRLQRGPLTNVTADFEKYWVEQGSPISTMFPAIEAEAMIDLIAPMTATRIKNDYYAIKKLYACAEELAATAISKGIGLPPSPIRALGRHIMQPYYRHIRLSLLDIIDSNRSKDKLEDAQHAILNVIRDAIIRGLRDSRYELALQIQTGSAEQKPTIGMLTNSILGRYMFQMGDARILGSLPYPILFGTHASELLGQYGSDEHELFIVPLLPGKQCDPLNFGYHFWKPESASTLQVTRNGSTVKELVVIPYNGWHMFCPWMIRVTVTDIELAMNSKIPRLVAM